MRIFTYELIFPDTVFKKMLRTRNEDMKFQQGHIHFSGVTDPGEIVLAGSMTPRKSIKN
jgi:hypothetical protein